MTHVFNIKTNPNYALIFGVNYKKEGDTFTTKVRSYRVPMASFNSFVKNHPSDIKVNANGIYHISPLKVSLKYDPILKAYLLED